MGSENVQDQVLKLAYGNTDKKSTTYLRKGLSVIEEYTNTSTSLSGGSAEVLSTIYAGGILKIDGATGKKHYLYKDALGSTSLVLDESGSFVARYKVDPFGSEEYSEMVSNFNETTMRFTGKEMDEESGLQYFGARYYDPFVGRWTGKDIKPGRLNRPQSLNRYLYVENNPLVFLDPTGKKRSGTSYWLMKVFIGEENANKLVDDSAVDGFQDFSDTMLHGMVELPTEKLSDIADYSAILLAGSGHFEAAGFVKAIGTASDLLNLSSKGLRAATGTSDSRDFKAKALEMGFGFLAGKILGAKMEKIEIIVGKNGRFYQKTISGSISSREALMKLLMKETVPLMGEKAGQEAAKALGDQLMPEDKKSTDKKNESKK